MVPFSMLIIRFFGIFCKLFYINALQQATPCKVSGRCKSVARQKPSQIMRGLLFCKLSEFSETESSDDFLAVIELAFDIRIHTVFNGPFGFVFDGLRVNAFHSVLGADDARRAADDEGIWRDDLVFHDDGTGGDDGAFSDDGAGQNGGAHTDEDVIFDDAAVHAGAMPDGDVIADDARIIIRDVQACEILDICAFADGNIIHIAARNDARPDAGVFSDADIAVQMRAGSDEGFFMNLRCLAFEFFACECVHGNGLLLYELILCNICAEARSREL